MHFYDEFYGVRFLCIWLFKSKLVVLGLKRTIKGSDEVINWVQYVENYILKHFSCEGDFSGRKIRVFNNETFHFFRKFTYKTFFGHILVL